MLFSLTRTWRKENEETVLWVSTGFVNNRSLVMHSDRSIETARAQPITWTVDDDGPADFYTIQEAIDAASDGDVIFVRSGTYRVTDPIYPIYPIRITKSLTLLGENPSTTVIENVFYVQVGDTCLSGLTVGANPPWPLWYGVGPVFAPGSVPSIDNGILDNNVLLGNGWENYNAGNPSIVIGGSGWRISGNKILPYPETENLLIGLMLCGGNNIVVGNTVGDSSHQNAYVHSYESNILFHNNFYTAQDPVMSYLWINSQSVLDDGYPSGGNYWSFYNSADICHGPNQDLPGSDGIGDTPLIIDPSGAIDHYPLVNPWTPTEASVRVQGKDYPVTIVSNTTLDQIITTPNTLHFKSSGPTGDTGYINVIFPMVNTTDIKVFIDGNKLTPPPFPVINSNGTHYFIYFEFPLSSHDITLQFAIPVGGEWLAIDKSELLSPLIASVTASALTTAIFVYVKRKRKQD